MKQNQSFAAQGMLVAKIGGPAFRIGVGGGAASSAAIQGGTNEQHELDFSAVQRGDAEVEQKLNRLIRTCIESGKDNPILSIHDQVLLLSSSSEHTSLNYRAPAAMATC